MFAANVVAAVIGTNVNYLLHCWITQVLCDLVLIVLLTQTHRPISVTVVMAFIHET